MNKNIRDALSWFLKMLLLAVMYYGALLLVLLPLPASKVIYLMKLYVSIFKEFYGIGQ